MRPLSDARLVEVNTFFLLYKEITSDCLIFFFFFFFILLVALVVRMMHCTAPVSGSFGGEMSVLARQRAQLRWQVVQGQEEEEAEVVMVMMQSSGQSFPDDVRVNSTLAYQHLPAGVFPPAAKKLDNGWPDFTGAFLSRAVFSGENGVSPATESFASISTTASCSPMVGNAAASVVFLPEKVPPPARKRKAVEKAAMPTRDYKDKKVIGEAQEDQAELAPKQSDQSSINKHHNSSKNIEAAKKEASVDTSKDNSKASEVQQKADYIHVRARRGQATDSHSLAERVRREKISERMKCLQDLVPSCNKITSKAGMLDEIINFVQSLQRQVEVLSMKLATVNPRLDFNIDDFFAKKRLLASIDPFTQVSMLPDLTNQAFLQYNPPQPVVSFGGLNVATNPPEISVRGTSSAPVAAPDGFLDTCFNGGQASSSTTWDSDLHTLDNADLHQGRQSLFSSQQFHGNIEVKDVKMEM